MPNYVHTQLTKCERSPPKRQHNCTYAPEPRKYRKLAQDITPEPKSAALDVVGKAYVQQVVVSFLYYARATDLTIIHALNSIAADSSKNTERSMERLQKIFDYMCSNAHAIICFQ